MTQNDDISPKSHAKTDGLPLRRLELALNRIISIAIPFHLKNLEKHKHNIQSYRFEEEWDKLLKEQINASQTVQQLKADLRELDNLRKQVRESDLDVVNSKIAPIKTEVCSTLQQFIELHADLSNPLLNLSDSNYQNSYDQNCDNSVQSDEVNSNLQMSAQISEQKSAFVSWQNLRKELSDLNAMFNTVASTIMGQKDQLNRIEDNITTTHEDVTIGTKHLSKAAALKSTLVPVTAALVGGAVFGPIGMMAGFKFSGFASAVGASILTYSGVKLIQKKSITNEEEEAQLILLNEKTSKEKSNNEVR